MRARLKGAPVAFAVASLMALPPAAGAQDPLPTISPTPTPTATATPTPTPTPTPEELEAAKTRKRKVVRRIYRDFEKDGRIAQCDHSLKALRLARDSISDEYETDYPDFKDALRAAIRANKAGKCDVEPTPTPTPTATATPAPTQAPSIPSTPAPVTPLPTPSSTPESGQIPGLGGSFDDGNDNGGSGSGGGTPKGGGAPTPGPGEGAIPEGTPAPTPAPTTAPPPEPKLVVTRASADPNLFVPGTMLAISLLGLLFAALSALAARRSGRLAGVGHAWREAGFRASGAWAEFKDWLRLGR
jgi:hypothetical protein